MIETGDAIATFIDKISKAAEASALRDRDILLDAGPAGPTRRRGARRRRQPLLHRDDQARAARRRRPGGTPLLRLRPGPPGAARRDRPAVRARPTSPVDVPDLARRRHVVRRVARRRADRPDPPRPAPARRTSSTTPRSSRSTDGVTGRQLPEGVLVCNFPRGLMEHDDVVTLFHEFGHLIHHVLGGHQRWARFAGVATEWDFVEAPSQLLEEWAWDAAVLEGFATDEERYADPGRPGGADARRRRTSARGCTPGRRCSTPRCPTGSTRTPPADGAAITRAVAGPAGGVLDGRAAARHPLPRRRSGTSTATRRATTPTCGRW